MKIFFSKKLVATACLLLAGMLCAAGVAAAMVPLLGFDDVNHENLNYDAITYVHDQGIVSGYPDGTYKPSQLINRAEFTKIIMGAKYTPADIEKCGGGNPEDELYFLDVAHTEWYANYICIASRKGVIEGYRDGTFKPAAQINFAEAAKIIVEGLGYGTNSSLIWYERYVRFLESKNAIPTSIKSFEQKITRGEMAEIIYRLKANVTDKGSATYDGLAGAVADYASYAKWEIPMENFKNVMNVEGEDCVAIDSGYTYGGDLLSSMIASAEQRAMMDLRLYTQAYVKGLEGKIVNKTHAKWNKDFYAFYVCHLGPNLDVASGLLYTKGESTTSGLVENFGFGRLNPEDGALAMVYGDTVFLYDDSEVPVIGNTATGGEPPICTGEGAMAGILWRCFMGLHINSDGNPDGETYGNYSIMIDGSKPSYHEEAAPMPGGGE